MTKEETVINYYVLCNKLKNLIRTGWNDWHVKRDRIESVAEHIYSTQMLAVAMYSEYYYDLDLARVLCMLAIHELGETIIGDLTQFEISPEEKKKIEREAVHQILGSLFDGQEIEKLFLEFDDHETKEAKFAYQCDKLECDLQSKLYDQEHCVDVTKQDDNNTAKNPIVRNLLDNGASFSEMWIKYGQQKYNYDRNFRAVSDYALENKLEEPFTDKIKIKIKKDLI